MTTLFNGFKKTRHGLIPDSWSYATLADATSLLKDGTHFSPQSTEGPFRYITSKNIRFGKLDLSNCSYISKEDHNRIFAACPVRKGDVLLTKDGANTGNAALNTLDEPISLLSSVAILRGNEDVLANNFLLQFILSPRGQYAFISEMAGQAITRLTLTTIGQIEVPLPPLPEQQKIAAILSTWDRAIELTEKLIAAKQKRKQALMQQLITGKVRFKEFTQPWSDVKAGTAFKKRSEKGQANLPTLSVTMDRGLVRRDSIDRKMETTLEEGDHLLVRKGDIAYNMMRMWQGASGLAEVDGIVSPAYVVLQPTAKVDSLFAAYLFKLPRTIKHFEDYSFGLTGDRLRLYYKDFAIIRLRIPTVKEQRAIASILATQDDELKILHSRVSSLQKQKKGLMQQLLTGKVRVKVDSES